MDSDKDNKVTAGDLYDLWLSGLSIRNIGKRFGLGRMSVHSILTKHYGKDACNLRKQSLSRVIYQEYGDKLLAQRASGSDGLYRTTKSEKNYTRCQTYEAVVNNLTYEPEAQALEMNLNIYLWVCLETANSIYECQLHNQLLLNLQQ